MLATLLPASSRRSPRERATTSEMAANLEVGANLATVAESIQDADRKAARIPSGSAQADPAVR